MRPLIGGSSDWLCAARNAITAAKVLTDRGSKQVMLELCLCYLHRAQAATAGDGTDPPYPLATDHVDRPAAAIPARKPRRQTSDERYCASGPTPRRHRRAASGVRRP
jgi:hypothetical protein